MDATTKIVDAVTRSGISFKIKITTITDDSGKVLKTIREVLPDAIEASMDTTTVLEIIKMLDTRIDQLSQDNGHYSEAEGFGARTELISLSCWLHSFIEGQLNAVENQSPE
jgi:hypothetical protein